MLYARQKLMIYSDFLKYCYKLLYEGGFREKKYQSPQPLYVAG